MNSSTLFLYFVLLLGLSSCKSSAGLNFYSPRYDQRMGEKIKREIEREPDTYPILPETDNEKIYTYLRGIINNILETDQLKYKEEFAWEVHLINDGETLNAFVTPGGFIYIYTGLIKYLESEDQLAGVLAHEMAHADLRHASRQLSQRHSMSTILLVTTRGNPDLFTNIGASLVSLKFSRRFEKEADRMAIGLLCSTHYNAAGVAGFFEKLETEGQKRLPAFLSTHPNPGKRIEKMKAQAEDLACTGTKTNRKEYMRMKRLLD